jgi:hypothetical protein
MKFKEWYDEKEGILYVDVIERLDAEAVGHLFTLIPQKYSKEQLRYWLVKISDEAQKLVDKETRQVAAEKIKVLHWDKIAFYGAKPGLRMISKIVLTAAGRGDTTKFFKNEEEARAWLKEGEPKDEGK